MEWTLPSAEATETDARPSDDPTYARFHDSGVDVEWWPHEGGYWFVAGYEAVLQAATDYAVYSSRHDLPTGSTPFNGVMVPPSPMDAIPLEMDPPDHEWYRRLLYPRFAVKTVREMEPRISALITDLLDAHVDAGQMDLFDDLVKLVPATLTLEMLGLETGQAAAIADAMMISTETPTDAQATWFQIVSEILRTVSARKAEPRDDLISDLCRSEVAGKPVPDQNILKVAVALILGGATSPAKMAYDAFRYLGRNPDAKQHLVDHPESIPAAVEEFLRLSSPIGFIARTAACDTELAGQPIAAGDRVVLGWGAANRDPDRFAEPNCARFDRDPNPHLAMGRGIHRCLGAELGRVQDVLLLREVLARIPDYTLAADDGRRDFDGLPRSLPIVFTPQARSER